MRIIHTGDLHLESSLIRLSPEQAKERKNELYKAFERTVDEAVRLGARLFIIAGDLFDTGRISKRAAERVTSVMERHPEIDFLYLRGNHEGTAFCDKLISPPKNLRVFEDDWTYFEYGEIVIAGRNTIAENMFDTLKLDSLCRNIVVLHGPVREYSGSKDGISLPDAARTELDYLALGHYHSYAEYRLSDRACAVYCGAPEGRGFDEPGEHGFVVIDTDTPNVSHRFIPTAKRCVHIAEVELDGSMTRREVEDAVAERIYTIPSSDLVRVVLTGKRAVELNLDTYAISERWRERFYYFEVKDETGLDIDPMSYAHDKSLKGEFIRLVYSRDDLAPELRDRIVRCGIGALMGEDFDL